MKLARVTVQLPGAPEARVLDTVAAFLIVNEEGRAITGTTLPAAELAAILRQTADEVESNA